MPSFIALIIVYSLFVSFFGRFNANITSPLLSYLNIQTRFILDHLLFFCLGTLGVTFLFFKATGGKEPNLFKNYLSFIGKTAIIFIGGFFTSFVLLFLIAAVELNVLSLTSYISPKILGVESNTQVIKDRLKGFSSLPVIIAGENRGSVLSLTIAQAQAGKDSFYGGRIIPYFPSFLVIPARLSDSGVLLVGNSLIITDIRSSDFQKIGPITAYLMIKSYFPGKAIKSYPELSIMDKNEYLSFRKGDFEQKLQKFDEVVATIKEDIKSINSDIEDLETKVSDNESELKTLKLKREKEYTKCINTGHYESGVFIKENTKEYCQRQMEELDALVKKTEDDGKELNSTLEKDKEKLGQYQSYETFYANQKILTQEESTYISYEFGTFNPPDSIKILLSFENTQKAMGDYFVLLVHEYLHYARFDGNGKNLSTAFFDEGLTEYFARKIIKSGMGVDTNLSYPVNIKIIDQITKRISENDLFDVYYQNDQAGLEKLLDRVYGENFYKNNIILFETLQYTSDQKQILKVANDLMSELGGEALNEKDLKTTYSTFQ